VSSVLSETLVPVNLPPGAMRRLLMFAPELFGLMDATSN